MADLVYCEVSRAMIKYLDPYYLHCVVMIVTAMSIIAAFMHEDLQDSNIFTSCCLLFFCDRYFYLISVVCISAVCIAVPGLQSQLAVVGEAINGSATSSLFT